MESHWEKLNFVSELWHFLGNLSSLIKSYIPMRTHVSCLIHPYQCSCLSHFFRECQCGYHNLIHTTWGYMHVTHICSSWTGRKDRERGLKHLTENKDNWTWWWGQEPIKPIYLYWISIWFRNKEPVLLLQYLFTILVEVTRNV